MRLVAGVIAVAYGILLLLNTCFFAAGTDTSGYLNHARLLASGKTSASVPAQLTQVFTPYGFTRGQEDGRMVPIYPVGLPLHLAVASLAGWRYAPFLVVPLLAMATLFLFVAVAQLFGIAREWAIAGAAILAASPVFIFHAVQTMSDVVATFWTLLAIWAAMKNRALTCGLALAIAVAVRPTDLLIVVPLVFALGSGGRPILLLRTGIAAFPPLLVLLFYQAHLYGSPWKTGYGGAGDVISFLSLPPCLGFHFTTLALVMSPLVMPIGLVALFDRGLERSKRAILVSWFAVFFVFYSFYSYCPSWTSSRFLLPALPPLIILALRACMLLPRRVAIAAVVLVLGWEVRQIGSRHALNADEWDSIFPRFVAMVESKVPRDAVVLSNHFSGVFYFQSGRITPRWDQLDPATSALLRQREGSKPWFAVVGEAEGGRAELMRHVPGEWVATETLRDVTLWRMVQ